MRHWRAVLRGKCLEVLGWRELRGFYVWKLGDQGENQHVFFAGCFNGAVLEHVDEGREVACAGLDRNNIKVPEYAVTSGVDRDNTPPTSRVEVIVEMIEDCAALCCDGADRENSHLVAFCVGDALDVIVALSTLNSALYSESIGEQLLPRHDLAEIAACNKPGYGIKGLHGLHLNRALPADRRVGRVSRHVSIVVIILEQPIDIFVIHSSMRFVMDLH